MTAPITGGCLCGACRYTATGSPIDVRVCHCRTCQKATGAPLYARVRMPAGSVTIEGPVGWYPSSAQIRRGFCPACGTSLFSRRTDGSTVSLLMGSLDEPDRFAPSEHIWVSARQSWLVMADGLPSHDEGPPG